jgi:hypothetical protein
MDQALEIQAQSVPPGAHHDVGANPRRAGRVAAWVGQAAIGRIITCGDAELRPRRARQALARRFRADRRRQERRRSSDQNSA